MELGLINGAGDRNRTDVVSLEGWSSTIELHPRVVSRCGIEPQTHWLKVSCSTAWATGTENMMAGAPGFEPGRWQSQSLLPYRLAMPQFKWWRGADSNCRTRRELIYSQPRLATSLPLHHMVPTIGLEPTTYWLQISCSANWAKSALWWRLTGSNRWPSACKADALPTELSLHIAYAP